MNRFVRTGITSLLGFFALFAALLVTADTARAEEVSGRVFFDADENLMFEPGIDEATPGTLVVLRRTDPGAPPEENAMVTDPEGRYRFLGLVPGGTYALSLPQFPPPAHYEMVLVSLPSPPTPIPPTGFEVPPGPPITVDLPWIPQDGGGAPPLPEVEPGAVVGQIVEAASPAGAFTEVLFYPTFSEIPLDVALVRDDAPVPPPFGQQELGADGAVGFTFPGIVLGMGEHATVVINSDQVAAAGLVADGPVSFDVTYDGTPESVQVFFRLRRTGSITGRVFDAATDAGIGGVHVAIVDLLGPVTAPPVATAVTASDGTFHVDSLPYGAYEVRITDPFDASIHTFGRSVSDDPSVPVELGLAAPACPRTACSQGELHEFVVERDVWVGDRDSADVHVWLHRPFSSLAMDHVSTMWHGSFDGPVSGVNEALTLESVSVMDGVATLRIRVTARGHFFRCGTLGRLPLAITARAVARRSTTSFFLPTCSSLVVGKTVAGMRVLEVWSVSDWSACHPEEVPASCSRPPRPPRPPWWWWFR